MSVEKINALIRCSALSNDELNEIIETIKYKRSQMARLLKASLSIGDSVNFTSSKTGRNVTGIVVKIAIKYVTVKTVNGLWRVPANMLTVVEDCVPA